MQMRMIELLNRKSILTLNQNFARFIVEVQDVKYNPAHDPYEPGEMYVDDSEDLRFVTQEECDVWNEEEQAEFEKNRDRIDTQPSKFIDQKVFTLNESEFSHYLQKLGNSIENLTRELKWESTIFLLDYPTPWLSQENDYEPVKH